MANPLSGGRVHIIGIGGIGMSAIAEVMAARGIAVQGSDQSDGANLRRLTLKGINVFVGHRPENLAGVEHVVISTAVKPNNPELVAAQQLGLPVYNRASALAALMTGYRTISVTGSHGKTTTTSMIAWMLEAAGMDPTALVGGVLRGWKSNARIGQSRWMVVEADESDGTFIELPTEIGVVTNIDPEHLDYYGTEEALHAAFETFFERIPEQGFAVAGIDNEVVHRLVNDLGERRVTTSIKSFGLDSNANVRVSNVYTNGGTVSFQVDTPGVSFPLKLKVPGAHNAKNAAAAIAVGLHLGLSIETIIAALSSFDGVDRRFTQTGNWHGVSIYDDYAHHPVEIEAVLSAARGAATGKVIAVMQPHRFSRLESLFDGFCSCFKEADTVLIAPVYAAGEMPNGFDRDTLVTGIRNTGHARVYAIDGEVGLAHTVASIAKPGDLVIGLGAGTITDWARALPDRLNAHTFAEAAE